MKGGGGIPSVGEKREQEVEEEVERSSALKKLQSDHLTKLRCTPRPRWTPLHSRQKKIPYETEAHDGIRAEQSTQTWFH